MMQIGSRVNRITPRFGYVSAPTKYRDVVNIIEEDKIGDLMPAAVIKALDLLACERNRQQQKMEEKVDGDAEEYIDVEEFLAEERDPKWFSTMMERFERAFVEKMNALPMLSLAEVKRLRDMMRDAGRIQRGDAKYCLDTSLYREKLLAMNHILEHAQCYQVPVKIWKTILELMAQAESQEPKAMEA